MNNKSSIRFEKEFSAKINVQSILNDRLSIHVHKKRQKIYFEYLSRGIPCVRSYADFW